MTDMLGLLAKKYLSPESRENLVKLQRKWLRLKARLTGKLPMNSSNQPSVNTGNEKESELIGALQQYFAQKLQLQETSGEMPPHFTDHRFNFFHFAFTDKCSGPYGFYRGFFSSEVIRKGDRVLDIGCGDGFFTRRFFAEKSGHIDAIDVEPAAIETATSQNSAPNITYHLLNAVSEDFPGSEYDVIIWDGAVGHFPPKTVDSLMRKIRSKLSKGGIFVGSEALGYEGIDHHQYFESLDALCAILKPHFPHIQLRSVEYRVGAESSFTRKEAYWRCALDPARLEDCSWRAA